MLVVLNNGHALNRISETCMGIDRLTANDLEEFTILQRYKNGKIRHSYSFTQANFDYT